MARTLSLSGSRSPPHLPRMPSISAASGPAVGAAQALAWSCPLSSCRHHAQLSELVHLLCERSVLLYTFCQHRVCLVDHVDLICSWCSWWEGFRSSSLATLQLGFSCGFIFTSACGSSSGVCSRDCPGGLGSAPMTARCGGGAAPWVAGDQGTRGIWLLSSRK